MYFLNACSAFVEVAQLAVRVPHLVVRRRVVGRDLVGLLEVLDCAAPDPAGQTAPRRARSARARPADTRRRVARDTALLRGPLRVRARVGGEQSAASRRPTALSARRRPSSDASRNSVPVGDEFARPSSARRTPGRARSPCRSARSSPGSRAAARRGFGPPDIPCAPRRTSSSPESCRLRRSPLPPAPRIDGLVAATRGQRRARESRRENSEFTSTHRQSSFARFERRRESTPANPHAQSAVRPGMQRPCPTRRNLPPPRSKASDPESPGIDPAICFMYPYIRIYGLMSEQTLAILDDLTALADITRDRLLLLVEAQELTVSELCAVLQLPQSTVSRHLKALAGRRLGDSRAPRDEPSLHDGHLRLWHPDSRRLWLLVREQVADGPRGGSRITAASRPCSPQRRSQSQEFFSSAAGQWDHLRRSSSARRSTLQALAGSAGPRRGWSAISAAARGP